VSRHRGFRQFISWVSHSKNKALLKCLGYKTRQGMLPNFRTSSSDLRLPFEGKKIHCISHKFLQHLPQRTRTALLTLQQNNVVTIRLESKVWALGSDCLFRFPVGSYGRLEKRYLQPAQPRAGRWWVRASERFTHASNIDSSQLQHHCESSHVAHGASRRGMGAADHLWHSKTEYKGSIIKLSPWCDLKFFLKICVNQPWVKTTVSYKW